MKPCIRIIATALITMFLSVSFATEMAPEQVAGAKTIDGAKAKELFDNGALFVDPRKDSDYEAGRIPGAVHLNLDGDLSEEALSAEAKKDEQLVFYCNGVKCKVSSSACKLAVNWGFTNVHYYRTGFPDWKSRGYPVE